MFAAAQHPRRGDATLIAAGANVKAATKVVNVEAHLAGRRVLPPSRLATATAAASRGATGRVRATGGRNQNAAGTAGAGGGAGRRWRRPSRARRPARPASTRQVPLQRTRRLAGRAHAAALRGAPGLDGRRCDALLERRRRRQPGERRRQDQPARHRHRQRPLRHRHASARTRAPTRTRASRERRHAALRRAQRAVGAQGALPAAARSTCSRRPPTWTR